MRPALKLVILWLILAGVNLGGLRQATAAGWSRPSGELFVPLSRSCSSEDPNRQHAPTLRLLKYGCAASSSSDQHLRPVARIPMPILRLAAGDHPERCSARSTPADQNSPWATGPPASC